MKLTTQEWGPDTCKCRLSQTVDKDMVGGPDDDLAVTFNSNPVTRDGKSIVLPICPDHTGLTGQGLYDQVLGENQSKNIAWHHVTLAVSGVRNSPEWTENMKNWPLAWRFTGQNTARHLELDLTVLQFTDEQKATVQAGINIQIGVGKVLVS